MPNIIRWFAVLPGAILCAILSTVLLHIVLYQTLTGSGIVTPYPEAPERLLMPFVAALSFIWSGKRIAPFRKVETAVVLCGMSALMAAFGVSQGKRGMLSPPSPEYPTAMTSKDISDHPGQMKGGETYTQYDDRRDALNGSAGYYGDEGCTQDCSGHEAGYQWAEDHGITDPDECGGKSWSFEEGCRSYAEEQQGEDEEDGEEGE